jgi:hypothetical protein
MQTLLVPFFQSLANFLKKALLRDLPFFSHQRIPHESAAVDLPLFHPLANSP